MGLYIGVDFHPHQQTVAYCDTRDGEIMFLTFKHSERARLEEFYEGFGEPVLIGVETTGGLDWFEEMIFKKEHKLLVGNPQKIRRRAMSRHKSDRRGQIKEVRAKSNKKDPKKQIKCRTFYEKKCEF